MRMENLQTIWEAEATLKNYLTYCRNLESELKEKITTFEDERYSSWQKVITSTKDKLVDQLAETKLDFSNCKNFEDYLQTLENAKYTH